ncbi:non-functional pseudokinase ZED1-like isoform X1 [Carya illinoinensis]|uniref:non-functional pseudokinase ZED1-like isoform X1 n=1 Tax=Carya illinoinensis TaxID=32201 RepID=UPI001C71E9EA|nr:non-functional pseudokinase ZED1-like isoform X1 [Carya illinoinensis]
MCEYSCLICILIGRQSKMKACLKLKRKDKEETPFMRNSRLLLEERIALFNGKCNPIRFFSAKELSKATNNYDRRQLFLRDGSVKFYKGCLEGRLVSVKKFDDYHLPQWPFPPVTRYGIFKDVVIGSNMSSHKNVLKLLGCCLETQSPTLVYEYVGHKNLFTCIRYPIESPWLLDRDDPVKSQPLPWKCRVRVAMGIANAVAYLHTAFSRPFVHRDIQPLVIILDENNVPKLIDFSRSLPIPEGQVHATDSVVSSRIGCIAPDYRLTGNFTEKDDVYYFGGFQLELLTGWTVSTKITRYNEDLHLDWVKAEYDEQRLIEIVDLELLEESVDQQQFLTFANLALSCISDKREDRPTITDVAKQLRRIYDQCLTHP